MCRLEVVSGPPVLEDEGYVSATSLPGALIDERYRVDRVIGRGGVGLVVAATHIAMAQRVAIKMIRDDIPMQRELLDRFQREARAAAMIRSEHVARVLDVGRLPTGRPYIVMEYLEGEDLEHVVARGPLNVTAAVDFTLQACEALAEAHRAGIIHRDLKPANLFLTHRADGTPLLKVLDFGISKIAPLTASRVGRGIETTAIMGSPGYMAPEQMKSTRDVDARADVWSLGTVLYEMLVGMPAFEGGTMLEILSAIAACDPTPPSARRHEVPTALDVVVARCLAKEPDQRYSSVAELATALRPLASPAGAALADQALRISKEPPNLREEPHFTVLLSEPRPSALTVMTPGRRRTSRLQLGTFVLALTAGLLGAYALRPADRRAPDSFPPVPPHQVNAAGQSLPTATPIPEKAATLIELPLTPDPPPTPSASTRPARVPPVGPPVRRAPRLVILPAQDAPPFGDRK